MEGGKLTQSRAFRLTRLEVEMSNLKRLLQQEGYPEDMITSAANAASEINTLSNRITEEMGKKD